MLLPVYSNNRVSSAKTILKSMTVIHKAGVLLIILLLFGFTFLNDDGYYDYESGTYDTLSRSELEHMVSDSILAETMCMDLADSFTTTGFTALKGITTFRGGPLRDRASYGLLEKRPDSM